MNTKVLIQKPKDWRQGQTIFNFLEWLLQTGRVQTNEQSPRMADIFHIQDEKLDEWYLDFINEQR